MGGVQALGRRDSKSVFIGAVREVLEKACSRKLGVD